ncbi:hypothetical protein [Azospirillum picis]|uniref:Uncharacterized protein n=1 Tax=Azospirillum picis TaxID=488438 RepID=A0ABU0MP55_9PROT|nr:hypothetical protein [Azospirillum picis]MBP2301423.1 hypothetical protein [Azospirillum picis]MDQ0535254.1 hypothetical protein [Azospirillum picis]
MPGPEQHPHTPQAPTRQDAAAPILAAPGPVTPDAVAPSPIAPGRADPGHDRPDSGTPAGRRRRSAWRLAAGLVLVPLSLAVLGVLTVLWTGSRLYDQPFVWYNLNRIGAVAERAARHPGSVTVVALGDTALRDATLDEPGMTEIAARRGVPNLQFLRIVHRQAQFADFEPLLDRLIAIKPTMILIDRKLLTSSRGTLDELQRYGHGLMRLYSGRPYVQDQVAMQYRRTCGPTPAAWLTGGTAGSVTGDDATAQRVRAFIDRAWGAGIRVALIEVQPRSTQPSRGLIATAQAAEVTNSSGANLPLWNYADLGDEDGDGVVADNGCADGTATAGGRTAFSTWLAGGIAGAVAGAEPDRMPGRIVTATQKAPAGRNAPTEAASLP